MRKLIEKIKKIVKIPRACLRAGAFFAFAFIGGIVPHHDVASRLIEDFYGEMAKRNPAPARIFLIAPNHFHAGNNYVIFSGAFASGDEAVKELGSSRALSRRDEIFRKEHGVTVHIPYIKKTFGDVPIIPILVRTGTPDIPFIMLRKKLAPLLEGAILILSMDFSHYKSFQEARSEDVRSIAALRGFKYEELPFIDVDCRRGAALFLQLCNIYGAVNSVLLENTNSFELNGKSPENCTSYATIIYGQ